jgi:hypothetical protein
MLNVTYLLIKEHHSQRVKNKHIGRMYEGES